MAEVDMLCRLMKGWFVVVIATQLMTARACDICLGDDAMNFNASAELTLPQPFNFIQTCGAFEAFSQGLDAAQCEVIQGMGSLCGCMTRTNSSCHLCGDHESKVDISFKSKAMNISKEEVAVLDSNLGSALQVGLIPTCEMMEAYLYSIDKDDDKCSSFRDLALSQCGCGMPGGDDSPAKATDVDATTSNSVAASPCVPCQGGEVTNAELVIDVATEILGTGTWTCGMMQDFSVGMDSESATCKLLTDWAWICGCNDGVHSYLGADTIEKQAVLAWLPRASGFLSIVGSSLIIWDVSKNPQNRHSLIHQLVLGISVGDIIGAACYCLSTLPIAQYHPTIGLPLGIYGAKGNEKTCTAQGFFVQLGYISVFFNLALSTYYLMVVKYGMRESQIKKYRYLFILPPVVVGLALAFAGIPFYDNVMFFCHVPPPYEGAFGFEGLEVSKTTSWWPVLVLSILPLGIAIVVACTNMIIIYHHVRKQEKKAQRWTMHNNGNNNSMSRPVLLKASLYTASFLLCWVQYFIANFRTDELWNNYAYWVSLVLFNPLMGFCNCLVYYRAKITKSVTRWRGYISTRWSQEDDNKQ